MVIHNVIATLFVSITKMQPVNQMFKKFLLLLVIASLIMGEVYAQHKEIINKAVITQSQKERSYEPNTIVIKVKKQFRNLINSTGKLPAIHARLEKNIQITSFEPMFPGVQAPQQGKNKLGQPYTDLSLTYILKYKGDYPLFKLIKQIESTGFVEYAEPLYQEKILVIPDDPYIQTGNSQEVYFKNMKAFEAFEEEQGDTNIVIGIIDTGIKWDHEDLDSSIKYNYADPIDGFDNDGDGYVDNFRGWDLGNNDNNPYAPSGNEHGTIVSGCAGASTNNGLGIAGTAYKCKILPIKASTDNPFSSLVQGYPAIVYAVNHNCKVINLSWGGAGGYSATSQDVINYAAIDNDVVVIAAAGNTDDDLAFYPASYDNVLSVAALDTMYHAVLDSFIETKASFGTYNFNVDIGAMGRRITSTSYSGYSSFLGGSSYASPLVAGAAGLLRSKYPSLNALQIAELLRVTADPLLDTVAANVLFKNEKLGKGRLNMYKALTDNILPAVRMYEKHLYNDFGEYAFGGDTISMICNFKNYLQPTNNATVTLSTNNPNVVVVQGDFTLGSLPTLGGIENSGNPFIIYLKPETSLNESVTFRLGYEDAALNYQDYQYFTAVVNPAFLDIDTNQIHLTVTSNGRFGYIDELSSVGNGLTYRGESLLFEGGLMISSGSTKVSDCVRGTPAGEVDFDYSYIDVTKYISSAEGDEETRVLLTDTNSTDPVGVVVQQRTYAHGSSPDDKYVVVEYDITNISGSTIDSLRVGIYTDWDIQTANQNKANWNTQDSIGYTYYTGANGIYAGVSLLTKNPPSCFSMDHGFVGGNNINPNDGFSTAEKHTTLSNGIARPQAGGTGLGFDVSQVVGGTLLNVAHNEKRTIAFAFVVGDDVLDLKANARRAKDLFRSFNISPTPFVSDQHYCEKDTLPVTITPGNGTKFNFYNTPTGVTPEHSGNSYTIDDAFASDTIYVRGADSLFESSAVATKIIFHSELEADFVFTPDTVDLNSSPYAFFVDKSDNALLISWDMGDGAIINNNSAFLHEYNSPGTYKVILTVTDQYGCEDTLSKNVVVQGTTSGISSSFESGIQLYPNPASQHIHIELNLPSAQPIHIRVYNTLGEEVFTAEENDIKSRNYLLDLNGYKSGIYYTRIQIGELFFTRTFIVQ